MNLGQITEDQDEDEKESVEPKSGRSNENGEHISAEGITRKHAANILHNERKMRKKCLPAIEQDRESY